MNSLRPLITITILGLVGAWLYVQINKGPAQPDHGEAEAWQGPTADGVPPLVATPPIATTDATSGTAPKWPGTAAATPPATTPEPIPATPASEPTASSTNSLPDIPAIPELPDAPKASPTAPPVTAANEAQVSLPANIPQARYPDATNAPATGSIAPLAVPTQIPPTDSAIPGSTATITPTGAAPQSTQSTTDDHENSIATDNAMAAAGFTPQPRSTAAPSVANPSAVQQAAPTTDRYGTSTAPATAPAPPTAAPPVEPTFTAAWPEIQAALDRRELARAHQLMSKWYGDDSLTPADAEKLDALLGQLAGTVVYSTEHQLEPAYVVQPGQNMESIAKDFNVPWQLLAKVNGVTSVDAVQPGQKLKVIRGPFSAVVDLRRSQLALFVDGRYAGKFPISVPAGAAVTEGKWFVDQKLAAPSASASPTAVTPVSAAADRTIVLRGEDPSTGKPAATGPVLTIASGATAAVPAAVAPAIRISPQDAEELSDILSVGSRVTVRK